MDPSQVVLQADSCSLWLMNRDLLDTISESNYRSKETSIIQLLGGTQNILKIILQNQTNLSHSQLFQLYHILKQKNDDKDIERKHVHNTDQALVENPIKEPITITDLNEDCLAYIYKFLNEGAKGCMSLTSRYLHVVSHSKKCLRYPLQTTSLKYRFYHFINTLCSMKSDDSMLIPICSDLCSWIRKMCDVCNENTRYHRQSNICEAICSSGLLPIISKLCLFSDKTPIDSNLIQNILFLMKMICDHESFIGTYDFAVINTNIIEHTVTLFDHPDLLQFFPQICTLFRTLLSLNSIDIQYRLFFNNHFDSSLIRSIVSALQCALETRKLHITTISDAVSFVTLWLCWSCSDDAYNEINTAFHSVSQLIITQIAELLNVSHSKKWISQLQEDDVVFIRNEDDVDSDAERNITPFLVKQIVGKHENEDINATCTMIGIFVSWDDFVNKQYPNECPHQQIKVPLLHMKCVSTEDEQHIPLFENMLKPLRDIMYNLTDDKIEDHMPLFKGIKRIFSICQSECAWIPLKDLLLQLLYSDNLFWDMFSEEIEAEFASTSNIFLLLECAYDRNKDQVDILCKSNWFAASFRRMYLSRSILEEINSSFRMHLLAILLENFHTDIMSYSSLINCMQLIRMDFMYFLNENILDHFLIILRYIFMMTTDDEYQNTVISLDLDHYFEIGLNILGKICFHLKDYTCLRTIGDKCGPGFNKHWWKVLECTITDCHINEPQANTKHLIQAMDSFIQIRRVDSAWFVTNAVPIHQVALRNILTNKLSSVDAATTTSIQNILSVI